MKDPIHYYLIVPFALLAIQLIGLLLYIKCKSAFINKAKQLSKLLKSSDKPLYILTRKEQETLAQVNEEARMRDNHSKLTMQGEDNE